MAVRVDKAAVGLGNPDPQYERTRHNLGFLAVDYYLERYGQDPKRLEWDTAILYYLRGTLIAKPLTYMNRSGLAVWEISRRFGLSPEEILIVYDDVMLPFGTLRARARGGAGGHHGMESIIEALGTEEIPRLRLGIGTEPLPEDLTNYVLSEFSSAEHEKLDGFLIRAADAIECFFKRGIEAMMNEFNG